MPGSKLIIIDEAANITPEMVERFMDKPDAWTEQYKQEPEMPPPPPNVLSIDPNTPEFHPCYIRVGVRIDGQERNDIAYYNLQNKSYKTVNNTSHLAESIEPYWRYQPSRQQRRAEERWERKHG